MARFTPTTEALLIPPAALAQVWIDFDGTITQTDTLDALIYRHAIDDSWRDIERLWQSGAIGSRECLEREFALLRISEADLNAFLDSVELDPGIESLLSLLDQFAVPRAVLSDGIDGFINRILSGANVDVQVRSNSIERHGNRINLICPHGDAACVSGAAHCKCASIRHLSKSPRRSIYIGDGRSDLCPARSADVVFAKGELAVSLRGEGRSFLPFSNLLDVRDTLRRSWQT